MQTVSSHIESNEIEKPTVQELNEFIGNKLSVWNIFIQERESIPFFRRNALALLRKRRLKTILMNLHFLSVSDIVMLKGMISEHAQTEVTQDFGAKFFSVGGAVLLTLWVHALQVDIGNIQELGSIINSVLENLLSLFGIYVSLYFPFKILATRLFRPIHWNASIIANSLNDILLERHINLRSEN